MAAAAQVFERRSRIGAPATEVFAWHLRDGAFERLLPPGDGTRVAERSGALTDDTMRVVLSVPVLGPVRQRWAIRHEGFQPGRRFVDVMERGPFRTWRHEHLVEPIDERSCELVDHIEFRLPGGAAGRVFGGGMVRRRLDAMFDHRHDTTRRDVEAHARAGLEPLRVQLAPAWRDLALQLQLAAFLSTGGHDVATTLPPMGAAMRATHDHPDMTVTPIDARRVEVRPVHGAPVEVPLAGSPTADPRTILAAIAGIGDRTPP